ncbi:replicative DNA helicase [Staphylococcus gallinarum]|uniref:Replicative DNA helicase n=1 Tax=Staphylococcus gallinarum TaxID=1293 RepID=A0A380FBT5_STAGA|nr:replicative DNA helicase [Staphylococcus gallinarum]
MDGMYEQIKCRTAMRLNSPVLGAIIIDPELINTTQEVLLPESFYRGAHQHIFRAMMNLNEDNKDIDVVTIMDQLSQEGAIE